MGMRLSWEEKIARSIEKEVGGCGSGISATQPPPGKRTSANESASVVSVTADRDNLIDQLALSLTPLKLLPAPGLSIIVNSGLTRELLNSLVSTR
jgi:hypothetical protein